MRWVVLALAAVEVGWALIANLALLGPLSSVLSRRPEKLQVTWERAWSWYPGQVTVRGLVIRSQTERMQTEISAPEARGRVGLLPLLSRRLVVRGLEGDGVVVRARHRLDAAPEYRKVESWQPPVAGLENPPGIKPEEVYGTGKHSWTLDFSAVRRVRGEEIWVDAVKVGPGVSASGDAQVVTRKDFTLEAVDGRFDDVVVTVAGERFAEGIHGLLEVELGAIPMPRTVPEGTQPDLPLEDATVRADLRGRLDARPLFRLLFGGLSWWSLESGLGTLEARASVKDGQLVPGSEVAFDLDALALDVAELRFGGAGQMRWTVPDDGSGWAFDLHSERFDVGAAGGGLDLLRAKSVALTARGSHLELGKLREGIVFSGELEGGVCDSIASWNELLPPASGFELKAGRGRVDARFTADGDSQRGQASAEISVEDAQLTYLDRPMEGKLKLVAKLPELELDARRYTLDGTRLELTDFRLEPAWGGEVVLDHGLLTPKQERYLDVHASVHLTDARPVVSLLLAKRGLPQWLGKVVEVKPVDGDAQLALAAGEIRGGPFDLGGDHAGVEGLFTLSKGDMEGVFYLYYRKLGVGIEVQLEDKDVHLWHARKWFDDTLTQRVEGTGQGIE
ncbi:MAG: hypothetical protein KDD11_17695 [Acidobacteria bacterium]|nr:hypothetical protein [Acidobacteriota bacterium]